MEFEVLKQAVYIKALEAIIRGFLTNIPPEQYTFVPTLRGLDPSETRILDAWHELFNEGKLCWGWDLEDKYDKYRDPWFHWPDRESVYVRTESKKD